MRLLAFLLRIYSFGFHLTLSVFLVSSAAIAYHSHRSLSFDVFPFDDEGALRVAAMLGAIGLFCTLLALTRWFRFFFVVWTLVVLYLAAKGLILDETRDAAWFTFGALGAFFGAAWSFKSRRRVPIV